MAVHMEIETQFDQRSVLQSANDMHRSLQRQGDETADKWAQSFEKASPRVRKAYENAYTGAAKAASTLRSEEAKLEDVRQRAQKSAEELAQKEARLEHFRTNLPALTDSIAAKERELVGIRQQHSSIMAQLTVRSEAFVRSQLSQTSALSDLNHALSNVESGAQGAATSLGSIGRFGAPAIAGIAAGIVELTSVASAASGVIGLLPAAIGGAAAAFGTLKLATVGFDQAMKDMGDSKKFAQDLQGLSPAAQQAALAIEHLMPAFTQLKNATQEAFFAGIGPQLTQMANTLLPTVRATTTQIAGSFNQAFKSVGNELMSPGTQANLQAFAQNIGNAFRNLVPAVAPLTQAFAEIARVGSSFMPQLAQAASQAAQSFANFIHEAAQSGQLQQWIQQGITVLRQMMSVVGELTRLFLSLGPEGVRVMNEIATAVRLTSDAIRALNGDVGGLKDLFPSLGDVAVNVFNRIGSAIDTFILGPLRLLGNVPGFGALKDLHIQQFTTDHLTGGPLGGGAPFGSTSSGANRTSRPGIGLDPALTDPALTYAGGLPVPAGAPGIGSGFGGGSASMRLAPYTWGNPAPKGTTGGTGLPGEPQVPYDSTLPPGYANLPQTAEIYGAENTYLDAKNALAQKQARLNQLEHDNTAKADDITKAKNDVINAEQAQNEAQLRLQEAANGLYKKQTTQLNSLASQFGEIGVALDADLGISKGLPGLADNLVRFLGSLAVAPWEAQQLQIANAPGQAQGGYGLMGMLGAQGAFGPQYTAAAQAATSASPSALGPAALRPGGAYPGDAALLANVPAGRYSQDPSRDLLKGLSDCSSSVGDLVNILDGQATGTGGNLTTGNAAQWLPQHGFLPGMGGPGDFRVGYNGGHMQATLPGGTPWNWGSDSAAANRGIGGTGADDSAFTQHYYRPAGASGAPVPAMATAGAPTTAAAGGYGGPSFPIPLPVTIVGGGGGGGAIPIPGLGGPGTGPGGPSGGLPDFSTGAGPGGAPGPTPGGGWGGPLPSLIPGAGGQGPMFSSPSQGPMAGGAAGSGIQSFAPAAAPGGGGGGIGITPGGSVDTAVEMASSLFPGAGQAAATGMKLANRAIQFGGQVAGIAVGGLMETFLPHGSPLADPGKSWFGKIAAGVAGARPALPNMAQQKAQPQQPGSPASGQGSGPPPGPPVGVQINNPTFQGSDHSVANEINRHQGATYGGW